MAAEISSTAAPSATRRAASMRPRRMAAEIGHADVTLWASGSPASMRPRRMAAEIPVAINPANVDTSASMRPRRMAAEIDSDLDQLVEALLALQ